jgi:hypothetical protein
MKELASIPRLRNVAFSTSIAIIAVFYRKSREIKSFFETVLGD